MSSTTARRARLFKRAVKAARDAYSEEIGGGVAVLHEAVTARMQVKKIDAAKRTFEGLLSTWEQDLGDDIVHRGAFANTLKKWHADKTHVIPLLDTHSSMSIFSAVGKLIDAKETADGLWTKWQVIDGPDGDGVLQRISAGVVNKMSMGYKPIRWEMEENDDSRFGLIRHLNEVDLLEGSLVLRPMNEGAVIDTESVKQRARALMLQKRLDAQQHKDLRDLMRAIFLHLKEQPEPELDETEQPEPDTDVQPDDEPAGDDQTEQPDGDELHTEADDADAPDDAPDKQADDDDAPDLNALARLKIRRLGRQFPITTEMEA